MIWKCGCGEVNVEESPECRKCGSQRVSGQTLETVDADGKPIAQPLPEKPSGVGDASVGGLPRVMETLLKKAAIDEGFREELIRRRGDLADDHHLPITVEERQILAAVPEAQLRLMISRTIVLPSERPGLTEGCLIAFLIGITAIGSVTLSTESLTRRFNSIGGNLSDIPMTVFDIQWVAQEGIRKYNLENSEKITEINPDNAREIYRKLAEKGYLEPLEGKGGRCHLCGNFFLGTDLSGKGQVSCPVHQLPGRP